MKMMNIVRQAIQSLTPYQSARRIGGNGHIWLNANEAASATPFTLEGENLNRYPECQPAAVISSYARYAEVDPARILVSRGADEAIELLIRTYCEAQRDHIVIAPPTYGMYEISAKICGVGVITHPLTPDRQPNWQALSGMIGKAKIIFLCSPNNPTGDIIEREPLITLLEQAGDRTLVVVDEAYIEFCPNASVVDLLDRFANLVILRTLSKAYGLAGIRCGFTLAHPDVIAMLAKVIAPYPIATPVARIAEQALTPEGVNAMKTRVVATNRQRTEFNIALQALPCVTEVFAAQGNFVLVRFTDSDTVFKAMKDAGIILRDFSAQTGLANCVRITIGDPHEMAAVINRLRNLVTTGQ